RIVEAGAKTAEEPQAQAEELPAAEQPEEAETEEKAPKRRKKERTPDLHVVEPPEQEPELNVEETYKKYAKSIRPSRSRMSAILLLTLAAILWTAINQFGWSSSALFASNKLASKILLGMMILCAILSADVLKDGIRSIAKLRFTLNSLIVLAFLVAAIDAAICTDDVQIPFCAVVCLELYFAVWGRTLRNVSIRRSLRPLIKNEGKVSGAMLLSGAWENGTVIAGGEGREADHVRGVLGTNLAERRMGIYAPIIAVLSLVLALVVKFKTGHSITWAWSTMMVGALPLGGFISFHRPFALLSARLMKEGAAISGWEGAKNFSDAGAVILRDDDVFPAGSVTLGGMKVYGSFSVGEAVGYAAAVVEASESGLVPLFRELRSSNNGRMFPVSQFRRYEGGGYGAEIGGDVVLIGSLRFMQLMGVYMHEGTKVKNAVYLSVNGDMSAVFALNYAPSAKVRRALRQVADANGIQPLFATRDFLITPQLVEERYKVPSDALEFPNVDERNRLANLPGDQPCVQSAVMTKPNFAALSDAVTGARLLRLVTSASTTVNLIGGAISLALMFLLTYLGAHGTITAMNMLLFSLVWALPSLILTGWVSRY
ncbi:MAG: hypothetical protein IIY16_04035, partial [Oscillospiraceae bacterium]|nr:hypothetical protein [Oscillospiraceae bacterium]